MAKVAALYTGNNSYGLRIELAQSVSGLWYTRVYSNNGYGYVWSKWAACEKPTYATRILNQCEYADAPEYIDLPDDQTHIVEWGFNALRQWPESATLPKYRLPA